MNTLKLLFSFCPRWERSALAKKANALLVPAPWSLCVCVSDGIRSLVPPLIGPPSHWSPSHWSPNSLVPQYTIGTRWSPISLVPSLFGPPSHWSPCSLVTPSSDHPNVPPSHWSPISLVPPPPPPPPPHVTPDTRFSLVPHLFHWSPNVNEK